MASGKKIGADERRGCAEDEENILHHNNTMTMKQNGAPSARKKSFVCFVTSW
jgi:hypothetical protein